VTVNYKKTLFITALVIFQIAFCAENYAQKARGEKAVKATAKIFYKKYLPLFGYPSVASLRRLRPFLSGSLYSSIKYERERMKLWSAKNPGEKPPVIEDLFVCDHYEPPARFRTGIAEITPPRDAAVTVYFDYFEKGKMLATCQTKLVFIRSNGRWLLDNIVFEKGADLRTLLAREDYETLPG